VRTSAAELKLRLFKTRPSRRLQSPALPLGAQLSVVSWLGKQQSIASLVMTRTAVKTGETTLLPLGAIQ